MTADPMPTDGLLAPASRLRYTVKAVGFALLAGVGSGALMATIAPESKFSLVGWLIAPLWILLEIYLELVLGVVGDRPKSIKYAAIAVLAAGFSGTWFLLRR
jgi:hypothetical protein